MRIFTLMLLLKLSFTITRIIKINSKRTLKTCSRDQDPCTFRRSWSGTATTLIAHLPNGKIPIKVGSKKDYIFIKEEYFQLSES